MHVQFIDDSEVAVAFHSSN